MRRTIIVVLTAAMLVAGAIAAHITIATAKPVHVTMKLPNAMLTLQT
jgi:hypothetical protein